MEEISIRPAIISDLEILLTFEQELIKAERPYDVTIRKEPVRYYDLKRMILDNEVAVFVAEMDDKLVSCGTAVVKQARPYLNHQVYAYFGFMYTLPQHRGLGINKLILDALRNWSISRGLHEMRLTVYTDNVPAIRAYEKAGFVNHLIEMRIP